MRRAAHLVRRFLGALWPGAPRAVDTAWVATVLTPSELTLWSHMPNHDRRHSINVARRVQTQLAGTHYADDPRWVAAALLHDVGKLDARLGPVRRACATLAGAVGGRGMAELWSTKRGITRRVGLYLRHPELGSDRIRVVGGRAEAAQWARVHHTPDDWPNTGLPSSVVEALAAADDD